jgi:membrane protein YdbS with pleckstrin-like domain
LTSLVALAIGVGLYQWFFIKSLMVLPIYAILILQIWKKYTKARYGYNDTYFMTKGGIFGDKNKVVPIEKIQSISIDQSPYQKKHHLASITMYHAAGNIKCHYLPLEYTRAMSDYILYKVESNSQNWM